MIGALSFQIIRIGISDSLSSQSSRAYVGAGESIKKIGKSLYVDSLSGEADTAIDIIKDIVQKIPNINYSAINIVYIKTKGGVVLVDGYIYPNKLYGAFRITSSSENIKSIRLFDGEYKLLP